MPRRSGLDPFATGLIAVSAVVVFGVLVLALMQNNSAPGTTTNPQAQAGPTAPPDLTATAIAFATQTRPEVLPHVTLAEAKALFDANDAKFVDVRVKTEYAKGHIQGAVNVPYNEVQQRVAEFPRAGTVIVYCQ